MPCPSVGENVPEVVSPIRVAVRVQHRQVAAQHSAIQRQQAPGRPVRSVLPLGEQRVPAEEARLAPADRPAHPGLHRADLRAQVLTVQGVAHLGAQRVPGAETGRPAAAQTGLVHQRRPTRRGASSQAGQQFVAVLAGVSGAADPHRRAVELPSAQDM